MHLNCGMVPPPIVHKCGVCAVQPNKPIASVGIGFDQKVTVGSRCSLGHHTKYAIWDVLQNAAQKGPNIWHKFEMKQTVLNVSALTRSFDLNNLLQHLEGAAKHCKRTANHFEGFPKAHRQQGC